VGFGLGQIPPCKGVKGGQMPGGGPGGGGWAVLELTGT